MTVKINHFLHPRSFTLLYRNKPGHFHAERSMNTTNQPDIIEYYRQPPLSSSTITNQGAFLLFILLLLCLPSHGQTPEAFCPERLWNFGVADNDEMLTHEFKIANNGNADLVIKSVRLSCRSCFSVELSEKEIRNLR